MREVVARLPSEFELDGCDIAHWLTDRLSAALREEARASLQASGLSGAHKPGSIVLPCMERGSVLESALSATMQ